MKLIKTIVVVNFVTPLLVNAHGGKFDHQGGHVERKTGRYHCHRQPCFRILENNQKATQQAVSANTPVSIIYRREQWRHWSDFDGDCMNTRHEILQSQATAAVTLSVNGCRVISGRWRDPFSGQILTQSSDLDVDHIVPLKWANEHGGAFWSASKKEQFANDPINLLAVDDALNQAKGAKGPDQWMPPNHAFRCDYLQQWSKVLNKYQLQMHAGEHRVFKRQLRACR